MTKHTRGRIALWIAVHIAAILIASCARSLQPEKAKEGKPYCFAPRAGSRMIWSLKEDFTFPNAQENAAIATRLLVGRWDVISVQTMATDSMIIQRSRWLFLAPDSIHRLVQCAGGPCGHRNPAIVAIGVPLNGNMVVDSATLVNDVDRADRGEVTYDTLNKTLGLHFGPMAPDAPGPNYSISTATDSVLEGRWVDGGLRGYPVRRGGVEFIELPEGYFCARRPGR